MKDSRFTEADKNLIRLIEQQQQRVIENTPTHPLIAFMEQSIYELLALNERQEDMRILMPHYYRSPFHYLMQKEYAQTIMASMEIDTMFGAKILWENPLNNCTVYSIHSPRQTGMYFTFDL